jgi:hypothetical protein
MIDTVTMSQLSSYDADYVSVSVVPWMARLSLGMRGIVVLFGATKHAEDSESARTRIQEISDLTKLGAENHTAIQLSVRILNIGEHALNPGNRSLNFVKLEDVLRCLLHIFRARTPVRDLKWIYVKHDSSGPFR